MQVQIDRYKGSTIDMKDLQDVQLEWIKNMWSYRRISKKFQKIHIQIERWINK